MFWLCVATLLVTHSACGGLGLEATALEPCANGSAVLDPGGSWANQTNRWVPGGCSLGGSGGGAGFADGDWTGLGALEELRGTHLLFVGDSILRQVPPFLAPCIPLVVVMVRVWGEGVTWM